MFLTRKEYDALCARVEALEALVRPAEAEAGNLAAQWASFWAYNGSAQTGGEAR